VKRMPLLAVTAAALAALSLGLSACGGDDDSSSGQTTTAAAAPTTTAPATSSSTVRSATQLSLAADPDGALKYVETTLSAPAGGVEITLTNDSSVPHDVAIEGEGESAIVSGGETATLQIADLPAGTYTYFCSVPGHEQAGMKGTLTVE
jgi:plastocyanin